MSYLKLTKVRPEHTSQNVKFFVVEPKSDLLFTPYPSPRSVPFYHRPRPIFIPTPILCPSLQ